MIEREKRWKLKSEIPSDKIKSKYRIEQIYSNINPDVRIRKTDDGKEIKYFHTVKYKTDDKNSRIEIEQPISEELYNQIFDLIDKKPVIKDRYLVELDNGLTAEIDHYIDNDEWICEVEFPTEDSMNSFEKPEFMGKEIIRNKSFSIEVFEKINNLNNKLWDCI